jgi:GT2 family glycosyltransferase
MQTVIVPVFNLAQKTNDLLDSISNNEYKPNEIIIIDNGSIEDIYSLVKSHSDLNINYIRLEENIGVNPAWNLGIKESKNDLLSILNNDIIVNKHFFRSISDTMKNPKIGVCIPTTTNAIDDIEEVKKDMTYESPIIEEFTGFLGGWSFTIRKEIINICGYIPDTLRTFAGDNFLFDCCDILKYDRVKIVNNKIFHHYHATLSEFNMDSHELRVKENKEWNVQRILIREKAKNK